MSSRARYTLLCVSVGLVAGWFPILFHGPIHEKFDIFYLNGRLAVWCWYLSRMMIGFWVGATVWPPRWYVRGPLLGALVMMPPGFVSLATPGCGPT